MGIKVSAFTTAVLLTLWSLLILFLYFLPGEDVPKINWFTRFQGDKLVHAGLFFIEAHLLLKIVGPDRFRYRLLATVSLAFVSVLLELIQPTIAPGRLAEFNDACANLCGVVVAVIGSVLFLRLKKLSA